MTRRLSAWWAAAAGYVALLFSLQPRLGFWVDAAKERWGVPTFELVVLLAVVATGLLLAMLAWWLWRRADPFDRVLLLAVLVLYAGATALLEIPQERLHYAEYGVLAGLIFFAARAQGAGRWPAAAVALVATSGLGYLDEHLQGAFWERRYFDWRDVQLNVQAAVLGTLASVPVDRVVRRDPS